MHAPEPMSSLPRPPQERELPDPLRHRRELLAVIGAGRPLPRVSQWALSLGAAAAVVVIAGAAAVLVPIIGHRVPGGHPGAMPARGAATACRAPAGAECRRTESFTAVTPPRGLTVLDDTGSVTITGSDRHSVLVTETLSYRGYPPVTTRPSNGGRLTLGYQCRSDDCGVAYDIEVPRSLAVQVSADTGSVSLAGLAGQVRAATDVGDIRGTDLSDPVAEFRTDVGSINAAFASAPLQLGANAGTGGVTLLVPADARYDVTASASVGSVGVSVHQDASSGHVIQASADVGSVTVTGG
jgi:hypothetical protein